MRLFNRGFIPKFHKFVYGDETWRSLSLAERRKATKGKTWYHLDEEIFWLDKKTGKTITVPAGYISDGATGAIDIKSKAWWIHDYLCDGNGFDGEKDSVSNWTASRVLSNVLWSEKRVFRSGYWRLSTFFLGGEKLKKW